jgi:hypothetical protein
MFIKTLFHLQHNFVSFADLIKPCHRIFSYIHYLAEAAQSQPFAFIECRFHNYSYRNAAGTEEIDRKPMIVHDSEDGEVEGRCSRNVLGSGAPTPKLLPLSVLY